MKTHNTTQNLPVAKHPRRRYSTEFKYQILEACHQPNTSIAQVAREHGLNANLIHNWKRALKTSSDVTVQSAFIPLPMGMETASKTTTSLLIELPSSQGKMTVHWPTTELAQLTTFLKAMQS